MSGAGRPAWHAEPGHRVRVTADDPAAVRRLTVTGVVAVPADGGEWACPAVRLVGAVPGADRIEVRLDPDLTPGGLVPGGYRVTGAAGGQRPADVRPPVADPTAPPGSFSGRPGPRFTTTDR
ncbi:MAG: hypothetical protein U0871_10480 [Gemmataceae bacterium]